MGKLILSRYVNQGVHLIVDAQFSDEEVLRQLRTEGVFIRLEELTTRQAVVSVSAPIVIKIVRGELLSGVTPNPPIRASSLRKRTLRWLIRKMKKLMAE